MDSLTSSLFSFLLTVVSAQAWFPHKGIQSLIRPWTERTTGHWVRPESSDVDKRNWQTPHRGVCHYVPVTGLSYLCAFVRPLATFVSSHSPAHWRWMRTEVSVSDFAIGRKEAQAGRANQSLSIMRLTSPIGKLPGETFAAARSVAGFTRQV